MEYKQLLFEMFERMEKEINKDPDTIRRVCLPEKLPIELKIIIECIANNVTRIEKLEAHNVLKESTSKVRQYNSDEERFQKEWTPNEWIKLGHKRAFDEISNLLLDEETVANIISSWWEEHSKEPYKTPEDPYLNLAKVIRRSMLAHIETITEIKKTKENIDGKI